MKVLLRPCFTDDRRAAWTFCGLDDEGAGILARVAPPSAFAWRDDRTLRLEGKAATNLAALLRDRGAIITDHPDEPKNI